MMQGSDSFRLIVRRGPQPNQSYDLNKDIVTLGRDITNDIVINDPEVSRHHMRLTRGAGGFTVEDLGSTNGTFVNGQRLTGARPLRPGDMIGLGETVTLAYEMSAAPTISEPSVDQPGGTVVSPAAQRPGAQQYPVQPQQPQQPYSYTPPQQQPQQQSPYQPAQPQQQPQSVSPYGQPQSPYASPSAAPPVPGGGYEAEYDPYAVREEEPRNTTRWILIGCAGLTLFCCCATVLGLVFVDQACLWDRLPVIYDVLRALGYTAVCS
ncbi:MAG: FHA domain-containing protein [Chloroflexi bacterium]|nr:FHA domain-containing protein [Chloroflexota bacterium]